MSLFPRLVAEEGAGYGGRVRIISAEVAHGIAAGEIISARPRRPRS